MVEVYLKRHAFISMIISAIEVYKKECLGVLLGSRVDERYIVEYAIVYQTAERLFAQVQTRKRQEKTLKINLSYLSCYETVGDFHSHPQYGGIRAHTNLSAEDAEDLKETDLISLVISINESSRHVAWHRKRTGIAGSIGQFRISIGAHYWDRQAKRIDRARIICPYALTFEND